MAIIKHVHKDPVKAREAERLRSQFHRVLRLIKFNPISQTGRRATWDKWLLAYLLHRLKFLHRNPFIVNWVMEWSGSRLGWHVLHDQFVDSERRRQKIKAAFFSRRIQGTDLKQLSGIPTGVRRRYINMED